MTEETPQEISTTEEVVEATVSEVQEEIKKSVPKYTRPDVIEELTEQNVKDIIASQEAEILNLQRELENKKACIAHYQQFLA